MIHEYIRGPNHGSRRHSSVNLRLYYHRISSPDVQTEIFLQVKNKMVNLSPIQYQLYL